MPLPRLGLIVGSATDGLDSGLPRPGSLANRTSYGAVSAAVPTTPHGSRVIGERAAPAKRPEYNETLDRGRPNPALHPTQLVAFAFSRSGGGSGALATVSHYAVPVAAKRLEAQPVPPC